jgi:hypothetical protein
MNNDISMRMSPDQAKRKFLVEGIVAIDTKKNENIEYDWPLSLF